MNTKERRAGGDAGPGVRRGAIAHSRTVASVLAGLILIASGGLLLAADKPKDSTPSGKIKGTITVKGELPKVAPLEITKDQDVCKDVPNESLVVGPSRGVENVVIALKGAPAGSGPSHATEHPVFRLINQNCRFVPHVMVMQFNQSLEISNVDPILHTARTLQSQVNVGLYPGRAVRKDIGAPVLGPAKITCEIHPWMSAYVYLTDNPYYAVTDVHGEYEIDNVPPGKYRVQIWHETLGTQITDIEVKSGKATPLDFAFQTGK